VYLGRWAGDRWNSVVLTWDISNTPPKVGSFNPFEKYESQLVSTPLKNMKVSWDYYSQYMEKDSNAPNHRPGKG
jgi:hypothetical protein